MEFQLDLYNEGIAHAYVIAKKLSSHKIKLYKKCGMRKCKEEILNTPHSHYCFTCMMTNFERTTPLFSIPLHLVRVK